MTNRIDCKLKPNWNIYIFVIGRFFAWVFIWRCWYSCHLTRSDKVLCTILNQYQTQFAPYLFSYKAEILIAGVYACKHLHSICSTGWQFFKLWNWLWYTAPICCVLEFKFSTYRHIPSVSLPLFERWYCGCGAVTLFPDTSVCSERPLIKDYHMIGWNYIHFCDRLMCAINQCSLPTV